MLTLEDYRKISDFKDIVHRFHFVNKDYDAFRKYVCVALEEVFGFHHCLFGFLGYTKQKETSLQLLVHNTPDKFVERFFTSGALNDKRFRGRDDVILYSRAENYRKKLLYRDVLQPYGYSDFLLCYLPLDGRYVGYLLLFREKAEKTYSSRDVEIMEAIRNYLAVEYHNFLKIVQMNNTNQLLISHTNYYPMGVVIMKDMQTVSYANEIAKQYMQELGTNPQFFSVFYSNELVPHIKNDLLHLGNRQIVRYRNFVFSVVVTNVLTEDFFRDMERRQASPQEAGMFSYLPDATSYIYILRDELSAYLRKGDPFEEYGLTRREREVAELLLRGKNPAEAAAELGISANTAKAHIQKIYRKTKVSSRAEFQFLMNQHTGG